MPSWQSLETGSTSSQGTLQPPSRKPLLRPPANGAPPLDAFLLLCCTDNLCSSLFPPPYPATLMAGLPCPSSGKSSMTLAPTTGSLESHELSCHCLLIMEAPSFHKFHRVVFVCQLVAIGHGA